MRKRTLHLRKEVLVELRTDELRRVAGGTHRTCIEITHGISCEVCPTIPFEACLDTLEVTTGCG